MERKSSRRVLQFLMGHDVIFWFLIVLILVSAIGFFLVPFILRGPSDSKDVPLLSYVSIVFFILCFWLLNKKTGSKE